MARKLTRKERDILARSTALQDTGLQAARAAAPGFGTTASAPLVSPALPPVPPEQSVIPNGAPIAAPPTVPGRDILDRLGLQQQDSETMTKDEANKMAAANVEKAVAKERQDVKDAAEAKKNAKTDMTKPIWSKRDSADARDVRKYGGVRTNVIKTQSTNELGDIRDIPAGREGDYRTETVKDPKTGLTRDGDWRALFPDKGGETVTGGRITSSGAFETRGLGPDGKPSADARWVQQPKPANLVLDEHFKAEGKNWADATPTARAAMLRPQWVTPTDTAASVGAGFDAAGNRTVSAPQFQGGGFATNAPRLPSAVPAPTQFATSPLLPPVTAPDLTNIPGA
jgi:hypothetical protein